MQLKQLTNIPVLMNTLLANLNGLAADDLARLGVTAQSARALLMLMQHSELRCSVLSRLLGLEAVHHVHEALRQNDAVLRQRDIMACSTSSCGAP